MNISRTTLRLDAKLKKEAETYALQSDMTLQAIFNDALEKYLDKQARTQARKIIFKNHDLGEPLDNLSRGDYYTSPK